MKTYGLVESVGTGVAIYGATLAPYDNGDSSYRRLKGGDWKGAIKLANPLNSFGKASGAGLSRARRGLMLGGAGAAIAARVARKVPFIRSLRSLKLKVDRHLTVRAI